MIIWNYFHLKNFKNLSGKINIYNILLCKNNFGWINVDEIEGNFIIDKFIKWSWEKNVIIFFIKLDFINLKCDWYFLLFKFIFLSPISNVRNMI